jgi:hypothetical protein
MIISTKNKNLKIYKDLIKRKLYLKKELTIRILKTLIRNQNLTYLRKSLYCFLLTMKTKKRNSIVFQESRCLLTGKSKTNFKITSLSRHSTKKLADMGLLQNIKSENY